MNPTEAPPKMPPMPARIAKLPRNARGFPVPYFVPFIDGIPDFRLASPEKIVECVKFKRCWICGDRLGARQTFVVGPMCCVNHTSAEPPSHHECAEFAVQACPFMLRPNMVRREDERTKALEDNVAGEMIKRNPGVMALWTTRFWGMFGDGSGGMLFHFGDPDKVEWWREGRKATRPEIIHSIETGLPALQAMASDDESKAALNRQVQETLELVVRTSPEPGKENPRHDG